MSDDLSPAALRAFADRLEAEAETAKEEKEVERLRAAIESDRRAFANELVDGILDRMEARAKKRDDRGHAADDEDGDDQAESDEREDGAEEQSSEEEDAEGHADILPGRWRPVKVFGAKIYSGPAEPDTVRYRNEKGQLQSRPGRLPGKPYQAEWEQVADDGGDNEEVVDDAAA